MFAGYYFADQVQRYRASPHKSRIDHVARALIERQYLKQVVEQHLREWLRFSSDFETRGCALPRTVRDPVIEEYVARRLPCGSASRRRFVRASVRIFLETDADGVFRRRIGTAVILTPPAWIDPALRAYTTFLDGHRGLAARTVRKRVWHVTQMAGGWARTGVTALADLRASHIQQCVLELKHLRPTTRRTYGVTLRSFLRWAVQEGYVVTDLRAAVMVGRHMRQADVRDVLTPEEIGRVLAALDRSSAVGRRDAAVVLLAIRYGMRPSDIRQLRLDNLRWRQGVITLRQAKTGRPLTLPLLPEIADALVGYLRSGRPHTTAGEVFVRHRAPFQPFAPTNNLAAILRAKARMSSMSSLKLSSASLTVCEI